MEIYVLGDAHLVFMTLNAVAAFFNSDSMIGMMKVAVIMGLIFAGMRHAIMDGPHNAGESVMKAQMGPWSIVMPILIAYITVVPQKTFIVSDAYTGNSFIVDNVPIFVGLPVAVTSQIGKSISEGFEIAFSQPDAASMTKSGFMDSLYVMDKMRNLDASGLKMNNNSNYDFEKSLMRYYQDCVKVDMEGIEPPPVLTASKLRSSTNLMDDLAAGGFSNITTVMYLKTINGGASSSDQEIESCGSAYVTLYNEVENMKVSDSISDGFKLKLQKPSTTETASAITQKALDGLGLSAMNAGDMLINGMVGKTLQKAELRHVAAAGGGGASSGWAMVLASAEASRNAKWITEKSMFDKYARPFMTFVEILSLAVAPLIPFILVTGSAKALLGWLMMSCWIALWSPIMTLINFFVIHKVQGELYMYTSNLASAGITNVNILSSLEGLTYLSGVTNEWLAIGAMLSSATPAIAMAVLGGSMTGLVGLAGGLGKADGANTSAVAPTAMDAAPIMRGGPKSELSYTSGGSSTGAMATMAQLSLGSTASSAVSSKMAAVERAESSFGASFGNDVSRYVSSSSGMAASRTLGSSLANSNETSATALKEAAQSVTSGTNVSAGTMQAIMGSSAIMASAGVGAPGQLLTGVLAQIKADTGFQSMSKADQASAISAATQAVRSGKLSNAAKAATTNSDVQSATAAADEKIAQGMDTSRKTSFAAGRKAVSSAQSELAQTQQMASSVGMTESQNAIDATRGMSQLGKQMVNQAAASNAKIAEAASQIMNTWAAKGITGGGSASLQLAANYQALMGAANEDSGALATLVAASSQGGFSNVRPMQKALAAGAVNSKGGVNNALGAADKLLQENSDLAEAVSANTAGAPTAAEANGAFATTAQAIRRGAARAGKGTPLTSPGGANVPSNVGNVTSAAVNSGGTQLQQATEGAAKTATGQSVSAPPAAKGASVASPANATAPASPGIQIGGGQFRQPGGNAGVAAPASASAPKVGSDVGSQQPGYGSGNSVRFTPDTGGSNSGFGAPPEIGGKGIQTPANIGSAGGAQIGGLGQAGAADSKSAKGSNGVVDSKTAASLLGSNVGSAAEAGLNAMPKGSQIQSRDSGGRPITMTKGDDGQWSVGGANGQSRPMNVNDAQNGQLVQDMKVGGSFGQMLQQATQDQAGGSSFLARAKAAYDGMSDSSKSAITGAVKSAESLNSKGVAGINDANNTDALIQSDGKGGFSSSGMSQESGNTLNGSEKGGVVTGSGNAGGGNSNAQTPKATGAATKSAVRGANTGAGTTKGTTSGASAPKATGLGSRAPSLEDVPEPAMPKQSNAQKSMLAAQKANIDAQNDANVLKVQGSTGKNVKAAAEASGVAVASAVDSAVTEAKENPVETAMLLTTVIPGGIAVKAGGQALKGLIASARVVEAERTGAMALKAAKSIDIKMAEIAAKSPGKNAAEAWGELMKAKEGGGRVASQVKALTEASLKKAGKVGDKAAKPAGKPAGKGAGMGSNSQVSKGMESPFIN